MRWHHGRTHCARLHWQWRQQPAWLVAQPAGDSAVWESSQCHHGRPAATASRSWQWPTAAAARTAPSTHYISRLRTAAKQTSSDFVPLFTPSLEPSSRWTGILIWSLMEYFCWLGWYLICRLTAKGHRLVQTEDQLCLSGVHHLRDLNDLLS